MTPPPKTRPPQQPHSRSGFSLIEVALALLVVAVGITTSFALFPEGMKLTRATVNDVEVALFADYVFSTLDMCCQINAANDETAWKEPSDVHNSIRSANEMLRKEGEAQNRMFHQNALNESNGDNGEKLSALLHDNDTHVFTWVPQWYGIGSGDYSGTHFSKFWTTAFTYSLECTPLGKSDRPTAVTLTVWPGYNETRTTPYVFYREVLTIK